jgi:WD40 repeat protein
VSIGFGSSDYMRIGDPETLQYSSLIFQTNGHTNGVNSLKLINDTHLASGSSDSTIKIWNFVQGSLELTINTGSAVNVIELLDNGLIAGGMSNSWTGIWCINNGSLIATLKSHTDQVVSLKFLSNGDLATGSFDDRIIVWDLSTYGFKYLLNCGRNVNFLLQLPNTNLVSALGGGGREILIWDLTAKILLATLTGHTARVNALELLPNGDLVSASEDFQIKVWDGTSNAFKYDLNGHSNFVKALKLISSELLASGSIDTKVKIWNITSRQMVREFYFNGPVYSIELLSKLFLI